MADLVSIIVPFYNCAKYLNNSLAGICKQNYRNFEIIFLDDGSTDSSLSIVTSFCKENLRLSSRIYTFNQNRGEGWIRNFGIKVAKGNFICFLDADDSIEADFLYRMATHISKGYDFVYCGFDTIDITKGIVIEYEAKRRYIKESGKIISEYFTAKNHFSHASAIYRRSFILDNNIAYPEKCLLGADIEFMYRLIFACPRCACVPYSLYKYYRNGNSISYSLTEEKISDCLNALKRIQKRINPINKKWTFLVTRKHKMITGLIDDLKNQHTKITLSFSTRLRLFPHLAFIPLLRYRKLAFKKYFERLNYIFSS